MRNIKRKFCTNLGVIGLVPTQSSGDVKQVKPGCTNYQPQPKYSEALSKIEYVISSKERKGRINTLDKMGITRFRGLKLLRNVSLSLPSKQKET